MAHRKEQEDVMSTKTVKNMLEEVITEVEGAIEVIQNAIAVRKAGDALEKAA
jgi:hypothetical protein